MEKILKKKQFRFFLDNSPNLLNDPHKWNNIYEGHSINKRDFKKKVKILLIPLL